MRRLTPNVLALVLLVSWVPASATAQRRQQVRPAPAPVVTAPAPTTNAERPSVVVERDPEDGATTFKLEPWPVEQDKAARSRLLLSAQARREAQPGAAPQFVSLTLLSRSPRCRFPERADVQLTIDGAPYALKFQPDSATTATTATMEVVTVYVQRAEGVLWVQSGAEEGGECAESLALTLSPQTFARLAAARAASLKIGAAAFPLGPAAISALRDLGGKMRQ